tara:strand:+ start:76 stop:477 length:402 start_codon:yes stop_codon:yes gene_type:complete
MSIEAVKDFFESLNVSLLLKDPSAFFLDYGLEISNLQISVIVGVIAVFVIELKIKYDSKKISEKIDRLDDFDETENENNEISSNPITQKIDLAIALLNMGSKKKSHKILTRLKTQKLTNQQSRQIRNLLKEID